MQIHLPCFVILDGYRLNLKLTAADLLFCYILIILTKNANILLLYIIIFMLYTVLIDTKNCIISMHTQMDFYLRFLPY